MGISADQESGETFGVFVRAGYQSDDAAVDFDQAWSCGLHISGTLWGRAEDEIGLGYSRLNGVDGSDFDHTGVAESYIRFQLTDHADLSFDVQYENNALRDNPGDGDPELWVLGTRFNVYF